MPTLFRVLFVLAVLVAAGYGAMIGIVMLLHPQPRPIEQTVEIPKSTPR